MKQHTLLAHLALQKKFSDKYENIAVEALGHILSESDAARHALSDVLRIGGAEVEEIARVKTQASDEEGTRPDLAGFDQHNEEHVLIEAKFWFGLTDNQPVAYLERLPQNQASALLFVAPAARLNTLWVELGRKVSESPSGIELGDLNEAEGLRSAIAGGKRRLMLISWTTLLNRMACRASTAKESLTESDIHQLRGLAEQMDEEAFLPLRPEELSPEFPRRLISLVKLVNDVIECLQHERLVDRIWNPTNTQMSYGRYLLLSRSDAGAWFGLDHDKWATVRDTPLWLYLYDKSNDWPDVKPLSEVRDNLRRADLQDSPEFIDKGDRLVIPIYLPFGVAEDAVLKAVVERIREIGNLIQPAD